MQNTLLYVGLTMGYKLHVKVKTEYYYTDKEMTTEIILYMYVMKLSCLFAFTIKSK
jgi:hypothetical protein